MAIDCDHPRPKLDLPGYIPRRMAWQVPGNIPGLPPEAARAIRQALQGVYNELSRQGQQRNTIPLVEDLFVRPGSVVVGVGNGQTVTLLPPGAEGFLDPVTLLLTDVTGDPVTVIGPDGTAVTLDAAGAYDFYPATGTQYETSPAGTVLAGGVPTDTLLGRDSPGTGAVEFITTTAPLEFTGAKAIRIATDGITDTLLRNSGALSVIGRQAATSGDPADILATQFFADGKNVFLRTNGTPILGFGKILLTDMPSQAGDTFVGNIASGFAVPVAVPLADVDSTSVVYDLASHTFQRAALTGDVTASQNSNALTITANAVTDAKLRQSAGLSVIGRSANSTGNVADITASGARTFLGSGTAGTALAFVTASAVFPGAPMYDIMAAPFNAVGDGIAFDDAALAAVIAAANAVPGDIYLGPAHRFSADGPAVTADGVWIIGRGELGGTHIIDESASGVDVFNFTGSRYGGLKDVWIQGWFVRTGGWGVRVRSCFRHRMERVLISQKAFGVEHLDSLLSDCKHVNLDDLYGVFGFYAHGSGSGAFNHAVRYENCVGGTDYPNAVVGTATVWATSTAYVVGNIVFANSAIYQCVQNGTSGASAPSGIPSTSTSAAHTATITDGTAKWVFCMPFNTWFLQGSYSNTFEVIDCGTLQGGHGIGIEDGSPGTGSVPLFCRVHNLQIDHPFGDGVNLTAGASIHFSQTLCGSVLEGSGINIGSGVSGNWSFVGGEIFGCNKAGIIVGKGDGALIGMHIGACGGVSSNTRDCIEVAASVSRFRITDCSGGSMFGSTSPATRYGLSIGAGADNYSVIGNTFVGNLTGGILNTPGRSSTRVLLNNVPDLTVSPGSVWGIQVDGATGVPFEITGLEVGELIRRETIINTTATGTVTTFAITNIATQVVCKSTSALTVRGMTATSATFGKTIEWSMHAGFAGSVTFKNEDASAASALERIACPDNVDLTITAGQVAVFTYFDSRWRVVAVTRAGIGLTDGDKGDVTVSATGTVWSIDNDVVTDAKLRNSGALSVIGRSVNSSGDPADISAATDDRLLTRTSSTLGWTQLSDAMVPTNTISPSKLTNVLDNTFLGNISGATAAVSSNALSSLNSTSIIFDVTGKTFVRQALTGDVTAAQNSNVTVIANNAVTDAKFRQSAALSVVGRSANSTGNTADISAVAASGSVLRESGSTVGFGTIATAGIANDAVTFAKIQNVGYGVLGNPTFATSVDPVVIAPPGSFTVLQDDGTGVLAFHQLNSTSIVHGALGVYQRAALTGDVTAAQNSNATTIATAAVTSAKLRDSAALSVIGRSANSTGVPGDIAAANDGEVLRRSGTALGFGTVATAGITDAAVTLAKLANLAQSTIIGRAEGAGTGVPTALTPANVVDIIDQEIVTRVLSWSAGPQVFAAGLMTNTVFEMNGVFTSTESSVAVNDKAIGAVSIWRLDPGTNPVQVSGMVPTASGQIVYILNYTTTANVLSIMPENTSSAAANRFAIGTTSLDIAKQRGMGFWYDGVTARWRPLGLY